MSRSDGIRTRAAIVKAAEIEFAEKGFDDASTRGICAAAGVNGALLNRYFGTKEALYKAVAARLFGELGQPLASLASGVKDAATWRAAVRYWIESFLYMTTTNDYPQSLCAKLFRHEVTHPSKFHEELRDEFGKPVYAALRDLFAMACADDEEIDLRTSSVWAQVAVYALADDTWQTAFRPRGISKAEWADKVADSICSDLFAVVKYKRNRAK